jgi:hypothetical protein
MCFQFVFGSGFVADSHKRDKRDRWFLII